MTALRLSVLAVVALAALGCGPTTPGKDGGADAGMACGDDRDCPGQNLFACNTLSGECEPACRTDMNCNERGEYALAECPAGKTDCLCDELKCVPKRCSADTDCPAGACRSGACVAAPTAASVDSCQITPDVAVVRAGTKVKFWVSAWDAAKKPVVVKDGAAWSAAASGGLSGSGMGQSFEFNVGATATAGMTPVDGATAAFASKSCTAKVIVLATPPTGKLGVVMTDELTGRPVPMASIVVSNSDTGASTATGTTDARGYAEVDLPAGTITVTAFHADYTYVTVARYTPSSMPNEQRLLSLVSRRNQVAKYGGYTGTFTKVPTTGNVHFGLTGMSIPGSITNISLAQLLGPSVNTNIKIGNIMQNDVPVPAGAYLGFNAEAIKTTYAAQGVAGVCLTSTGQPDEAKIGSGSCGTRTAYALAADVAIADLPISEFTGGGDINIPSLLGKIIPLFRKFNSSVIRDVQFDLVPTPRVNNEFDFSDAGHFTKNVNHDFTQMPLSFAFVAKLPELPRFRGEFADGALILGGAKVPGRGVVPLGLGVGVDTMPRDGKTDTQAGLSGQGQVVMRMAPTHDGIEGADYGLLVAALSAKSLNDASAGVSSSALFPKVPGNKLVFDPAGSSPIDLSGFAWTPFPDGTKVNYGAMAAGGTNPRSFRFTANPTGAGVARVIFTDGLERRWEVLLDPAQGTAGFTLPTPPTTPAFADRLFADGMATGTRSSYSVQLFNLNTEGGVATGGSAISFTQLVELNATNADQTTAFLKSFSFNEKGVPEVDLTNPKGGTAMASPAAVANRTLEFTVTGFKLGTTGDADGVVHLTMKSGGNPATGCGAMGQAPGVAILSMETTAGNGKVTYTLPSTGCTGALELTAKLVGVDQQTALDPAVSITRYVTVP